MSLRDLSRGRRWVFWSLAGLLWLLVAGLVQPPEVGRVLALGVPLGVGLVHLWMASLRREPEAPEDERDAPGPARRPRPPWTRRPPPAVKNGSNGSNGSTHTARHGPWQGRR